MKESLILVMFFIFIGFMIYLVYGDIQHHKECETKGSVGITRGFERYCVQVIK